MDYIIVFLYSLLCAAVGFLAAVKTYDECDKSRENLLQAHRDYEEAFAKNADMSIKISG